MTNITTIKRGFLRSGSAFQALALLGAGVATSAIMAAPAAAQDYTNVTASGRVQGTDGQGLAGATITVTSDQGITRTVTTDSSGGYRIAQIPSGPYTFEVSAEGYDSYTEAGIRLGQDTAANQFTLAPAGAVAASGDDIVVTAGRIQVVDFDRTTTGAVIELGELATRVPVARDITSVVLLTPGSTQGDAAFGSLPNLRGASVAENAYYINGLNITQFRQGLGGGVVPFDFYQTVDIKTGGYQAEFGRATGGIINAVTKSGSNEFHGGVLFNWEPDELTEDAPNTRFADNDADYRERKDVVIQLSGPIIKDRLFFYGIYNARDVITGDGAVTTATNAATFPDFLPPVGSQYIRDRNDSPFFGGKIDAIITDGHRLEFTYFNTESQTNRAIFGTASQATPAVGGRRYDPATNDIGTFAGSAIFRLGGENYVGRYTGQFTDWLTLSAAYGKNKQQATTESSTPALASYIDARPGTGSPQLGNVTANTALNFDEREFYRADADIFVNLFGSHHFRFGYDREDLSSDAFTKANGDYQISRNIATASTFANLGIPVGTDYILRRFFENGGQYTSRNEAFYLQDSWQLFNNRLTLQLGVRNDRFENRNAAGEAFYKSGNQWAPRLGFSFDPTGDNRTKVYGSYGRYFLPVAGNTNIRLAGIETDFDRYNLFNGIGPDGQPLEGAAITVTGGTNCLDTDTDGNCRYRSDGTPASTISTVSQNLKSQGLDEFIIGVEHRLGERWRFNLYYTHSRLLDALEDAAIDTAVRNYCAANNIQLNNLGADGLPGTGDETGCADIFSGTHQYVLLNPGRDAIVTLSDVLPGDTEVRTITLSANDLTYPKAERKYDAVTAEFEREFDGVWSLSGSYTYTKLRGNYEGGVKSDNGQTDTGLTTDFDLPGLAKGIFGPSPNERNHNFKLYGSYAVTDWLTVGGNFSAVSPRKFGCIGTVPSAVDAEAALFYGAAGFYCNVDASGNIVTNPFATGLPERSLTPRGSVFESDWTTQTNLDLAIKVPTDVFDGMFRVSVINVFNEKAEIDFQEVGTAASGAPNALYGSVNAYQTPRTFRFQLGVNF